MREKRRFIIEALAVAGALLLASAAYLPSFKADFQFDDPAHIVNNPKLQLARLSAPGLYQAMFQSPLKNRPLSYLSFALDYRRGGLNPKVFHQTNLGLHLLATLFVWLLLRDLFGRTWPDGRFPWPRTAAVLGAAMFAVHPLQTQSVTYIVQRMNLLSSLFAIAALWLFVRLGREPGPTRRRRALLITAAAVALLLGLLAKENAAGVFTLALAIDRCADPGGLWPWMKRRGKPLFAIAAVAAVVSLVFVQGGGWLEGYKLRDFTPLERLLTQPRVIWLYLSLWLLPAAGRLNLDHAVTVSTGLLHPWTTAPALLALVGLTALAAWFSHRRPLLALGWLWIMAGLAIESSILPLELAFEHRMYLPLVGLAIVAADLARAVRLDRRAVPALVAALALFAAGSYFRNQTWATELSLWADAARKSPTKDRPWANLCAGAFKSDQSRAGERWCLRALSIDDRVGSTWYNLGLNRLKLRRYREAEAALEASIRLQSDWAEVHYQLGRAREAQANFAGAAQALERAVELDPADPVFWFWLGLARLEAGEMEKGCAALADAHRRLGPGQPQLRRDLDTALTQGCGGLPEN